MFRTVREIVPSPCFFLLCDHDACGAFTSRPVNMRGVVVNEAQDNSQKVFIEDRAAFLQECQKNGWLVDFGFQLCPAHFKAVREITSQNKLITVPEIGLTH